MQFRESFKIYIQTIFHKEPRTSCPVLSGMQRGENWIDALQTIRSVSMKSESYNIFWIIFRTRISQFGFINERS